jgi:flagellar biosynthesis protein FlhF
MSEKENTFQEKPEVKTPEANKNLACIQLIYNQLISNEVDEKYANQIIGEIEGNLKKDASMDNILASIYQKIILKLGQPKVIEIVGKTPKFVFFIGPTGVGKTTTIAKIASKFKMNEKANVALLTADTYRIAAVEQLRTYANILGIPLKVVYSEEEMKQTVDEFSDYDIVFVDTAGRSHRNKEQRDDIEILINSVPEDSREVYLVLSATTKYRDLVKITEAYSEIVNYNLIFTKLDETSTIGNLFNIRMLTEAPLSYATFGQNVPDDISRVDAQSIAKQLLRGQS